VEGTKKHCHREPFAEVNLATGVTEQSGVEFVEKAVTYLRKIDESGGNNY